MYSPTNLFVPAPVNAHRNAVRKTKHETDLTDQGSIQEKSLKQIKKDKKSKNEIKQSQNNKGHDKKQLKQERKSKKKIKKLHKERNQKKIKNQKKKERKANKNKKEGQVKSVRKHTQASCTSDGDCLTNIGTYMKVVGTKAKNYALQKNRIRKYISLATSKGSKSGEFDTIASQLREAGGGNGSVLVCGNNASSPATMRLKTLVNDLLDCKANIEKACDVSTTSFNSIVVQSCETKIGQFEVAVTACSSNCTCWNNAELGTLNNNIKTCDLSSTNSELTAIKNKCTKAFSDCRSRQDTATQVIYICGTTAPEIQKIIDDTKTLLAVLEALKTAAIALVNKARRFKSIRDFGLRMLECNVIITNFQAVLNNPTNSSASTLATGMATAGSCEAEKVTLQVLIDQLAALILSLQSQISTGEEDLTGNVFEICLLYLIQYYVREFLISNLFKLLP